MGAEARCRAVVDGKPIAVGTALLETREVIFRGPSRVVVPLGQGTTVRAADGWLELTCGARSLRLELGATAERWLQKIQHPPSRLEKLGVKRGMKVVIAGTLDGAFLEELRVVAPPLARLAAGADVVFLAAETRAALDKLTRIRAAIAPSGAVWVVRPKGSKAITEAEVREAARAHGLVDVKVVAFSETHTAEKLVIPVKAR
jgi:hypothetical protein